MRRSPIELRDGKRSKPSRAHRPARTPGLPMTCTEKTFPVATIGCQAATVPGLLRALTEAKVELLIDVRAVASSRRAGFAKTALAANLETAGIDYMHIRSLGTPADGRAAARSGKHAEM